MNLGPSTGDAGPPNEEDHVQTHHHHHHTIHLDDDELQMLEAALNAFIGDFGHDEADVLRSAKALREKLREAHAHTQPIAGAGFPS